MSQKDYRAIAQAIKETHRHESANVDYNEAWHAALAAVTLRLESVLKKGNIALNRERFREACR